MTNRKYFILTLMFCLWQFTTQAQGPSSFRYQAVIQGSSGEVLPNKKVSFMITILESGDEKKRVYSEFHSPTTDQFGMVSLEIGKGNPIFKSFNDVNWHSRNHLLRVEMDETGGTQFKLLAEVELLSVPYAMYARRAGNVDDADADPTNELQTLEIENDQLTITQGNTVTLPGGSDDQTLSIEGRELSISNGNTVTLPDDKDNQTLSLAGNQLSIANGNTVKLPSGGSETPDPATPVPVLFRGKRILVHPTDNAEDVSFGAFADTDARSDHDGKENTAALVDAYGEGTYAAKVCDDLVAFGFDDWYLPARAELDAVFKQNYLIQDYQLEAYWTSTEIVSNKAFAIDFLNGTPKEPVKNQSKGCRCVRRE